MSEDQNENLGSSDGEETENGSNYIFSHSANSFYPVAMRADYEAAGSWPEDGVEVEDSVFQEFCAGAPAGKQRGSDSAGMPAWVNLPPLTPDEQRIAAESMRAALAQQAAAAIAPLQDAVDLGMATPPEEVALLAWKRYRVELNRVINSAGWPGDVQWPVAPQGE